MPMNGCSKINEGIEETFKERIFKNSLLFDDVWRVVCTVLFYIFLYNTHRINYTAVEENTAESTYSTVRILFWSRRD